MTQHRALVIPAAPEKRLEVVLAEYEDYAKLVFAEHYPQRAELDFASMRQHRIQFCYDDMGLLRTEPPLRNLRAMLLWSTLVGRPMEDFNPPLVGNYLVLGLNPHTGDTEDVPVEVVARAMHGIVVPGTEPTTKYCLDGPPGVTHHLIPRVRGAAQVLSCQYCGRTELELRKRGEY